MRLFEIAWLSIACFCVLMAFYKMIFQRAEREEFLYLFMVCGLAVLMFFVKRKSRQFLKKVYLTRQAANENDLTNGQPR